MANTGIFCKIPPQPKLLEKIKATKKLLKSRVDLSKMRGNDVLDLRTYTNIISRPPRTRKHTLVSPTREFVPTLGSLRALVLLVDFSDNPATEQPSHYEQMLFSRNTYATRSLRDFYAENSYGMLDVTGDVLGWYRAPQPYSYYTNGEYGFGNYPNNVQKLVEDAVQLARADVNFANYDLDGDGSVDALFIVHAGAGAEATGDTNQIWSHRWSIAPVFIDGVSIRDYTMEPEDGRIGVFCHELGHNFGLPDLYDTDYDSHGIGDWCLMAGGTWNNGGLTPAHMSSWCKYKMGWVTPKEIVGEEQQLSLASYATTSATLKLPIGDQGSKEYFLLENRRRVGFDEHIPGEGLLVWHVDENQINNNDQSRYLVALEQADGQLELESGSNRGDGGDPFPGVTGNRSFGSDTNPSSYAYSGLPSEVSITGITDPADTISIAIRMGEKPPRHALGKRQVSDIYGVSAATANKLQAVGVISIAELAALDVMATYEIIGLGVLRLYSYCARADVITNFDIDIAPFSAIHGYNLLVILSTPDASLAELCASLVSEIQTLKHRLAQLAASFDASVFKGLLLSDVG